MNCRHSGELSFIPEYADLTNGAGWEQVEHIGTFRQT